MKPHPLTEYLAALHSSLVWGDCAGIKARVSNLQQNRLIKEDSLPELVANLFNYRELSGEIKFSSSQIEAIQSANLPEEIQLASLQLAGDGVFRKEFEKLNMIELFRTTRNNIEETGEFNEETDNDFLRPNCSLRREIDKSSRGRNIFSALNYKIHLTLGQPGFGKTIHLQQFAEQEVRRQRSELHHPEIPLFVKATHLATAIENFATEKRGIWIESSSKEEARHHEYKYASGDEEKISVINQAMIFRDPVFEQHETELRNEFGMNDNQFLLIVDALDECDEGSLIAVAAFLEGFRRGRGDVVASCRYSHRKAFEEFTEVVGHGRRHIIPYHLDFTPHELRYDMPIKLANAWGIRGNRLGIIINQEFEKYQSVLTHPLFVGFFARLVVEEWDELPDTLSNAQRDARFSGEYNFLHISFLMNVIEKGIKLAIDARHHDTKIDSNRMKELLEVFSFVSLSENTKDIEKIVNIINSIGEFNPTRREVEIIKKGVGLLYSSDQKNADWVHKTIAEVGCGMFLFKHPKFGTEKLVSLQCTGLTFIFLKSQETNQETVGGILREIQKDTTTQHLTFSFVSHFEEHKLPLFSGINFNPNAPQRIEYVLAEEFRDNELAVFIHDQTRFLSTPSLDYRNFHACVDDALSLHRMIPLSLTDTVNLASTDRKPERYGFLSTMYPYNRDVLRRLANSANIKRAPPSFYVEWLEHHKGPTATLFFQLILEMLSSPANLVSHSMRHELNVPALEDHGELMEMILDHHAEFLTQHEQDLDSLLDNEVIKSYFSTVGAVQLKQKLQQLLVLNLLIFELESKRNWNFVPSLLKGCPKKLKLAVQKTILPTIGGER